MNAHIKRILTIYGIAGSVVGLGLLLPLLFAGGQSHIPDHTPSLVIEVPQEQEHNTLQ